MLKILDLDGFKYIGSSDYALFDHIPPHRNVRINCTYIHLSITNWEKDKEFFDFLEIHIKSMEVVKQMIQQQIERDPNQKSFHIVIRQDDDKPEFYGKETYSIGNKKPKDIKKYIKWRKISFETFGY